MALPHGIKDDHEYFQDCHTKGSSVAVVDFLVGLEFPLLTRRAIFRGSRLLLLRESPSCGLGERESRDV